MATIFQNSVWKKLQEIPRGRVTTYGEIARALCAPQASRAVGSACGANPRLVVVPCHRVVTSGGKVGEYRDGQIKKIELLQQEGIEVAQDRIVDFKNKLHRW